MDLEDEVSTTALITLKARVLESMRDRPILADPVGAELLESLMQELASGGCSVLDDRWQDQIASVQPRDILFLAEGLFMHLPKPHVAALFAKLGARFDSSEILFEVVSARCTTGLWKRVVESKMRRLGTDAGTAYGFGVKNAREVETFGKHVSVVEEWSYLDEPEIRPRFLRRFRNWKAVSRTQWTVRAAIGVA